LCSDKTGTLTEQVDAGRSVQRESAQDRADYPRYLLRLCELERIDRERRNVERRIRLARFPQTKSFDTFDFAAQPSLNKALVLELMRCEWIDRRRNCSDAMVPRTHAWCPGRSSDQCSIRLSKIVSGDLHRQTHSQTG
jgi:hypothetical protein